MITVATNYYRHYFCRSLRIRVFSAKYYLFFPDESFIIVEAPLNAKERTSVPHGNIDILVVSLGDYNCSIGVMLVDNHYNYVQVAASIEHTIHSCQSGKHLIY